MTRIGNLNRLMLGQVCNWRFCSFWEELKCRFTTLDFRANKPSDVISTLVSIYDSKDLFVKELQVLLAQRLLAITDDDTEKVEKEVSPVSAVNNVYTYRYMRVQTNCSDGILRFSRSGLGRRRCRFVR